MRLAAAIAAVSSAVALAACGGSKNSAQTTSQSSPTGSTSTPAPPATTTTGSGTATTTTTVAGMPACVASDFVLSFLGQQGATGHGELGFALHNVSGKSCHTYGYPGVQFLDSAGGALSTVTTHTTNDFAGPVPKRRLVVAPGASVSFRLFVTHGLNSSAGCTTAHGLQAIPPDDTATLHVTIGDGGAYECRSTTVSPLQAGTSAYP